jgi:hypothetical protein
MTDMTGRWSILEGSFEPTKLNEKKILTEEVIEDKKVFFLTGGKILYDKHEDLQWVQKYPDEIAITILKKTKKKNSPDIHFFLFDIKKKGKRVILTSKKASAFEVKDFN